MHPVYTTPDRRLPVDVLAGMVSPSLLFTKWHAWDRDFEKFERKDSRLQYLKKVADAVHEVYKKNYNQWYLRYIAALDDLGVQKLPYKTVWRLIVGWGGNPALEAGIALHHIHGFPYIPGSAVKGLLHHVAEMELMELEIEFEGGGRESIACALKQFTATLPPEPPESLLENMKRLQLIKQLFGSIHLEQGTPDGGGGPIGPMCPKPLLKDLQDRLSRECKLRETKLPPIWKSFQEVLANLLEENTGGMLHFYDAVPKPGQNKDLLQRDIVNCHYGDYYGDNSDTIPPSDDQNPKPITFLAVSPGVEFIFPFRLDYRSRLMESDDTDTQISELPIFTQENLPSQIQLWFEKALSEWGIGAKTAAGYGYFRP